VFTWVPHVPQCAVHKQSVFIFVKLAALSSFSLRPAKYRIHGEVPTEDRVSCRMLSHCDCHISGIKTCVHQTAAYCYGVVSYKASHALRPFSDLLCVLIWFLIITDSSARALWQIPAETPSSEAGRNLERNILQGSLIYRKRLRDGADGFTSPPTEVVLGISVALENPSPSAVSLGSDGKHNN
jgi:hypothetical protein